MKKICSVLLAALLLLSAVPTAFADGSVSDVIIIDAGDTEGPWSDPGTETVTIEQPPMEETPAGPTAVEEQPSAQAPSDPAAAAQPAVDTAPEQAAVVQQPAAVQVQSAPAQINQSRAVIGADLTGDQVALVYQAFGVSRGSVIELSVTNAEERQWLQGYVDPALIGTRSISSVYVELLPAGASMDVTTSNITWCTPEMYMSALATAGITDAKVVVAAPFAVSGTAALTGVYKAYEDMTGKKLDELAKAVSTQELTITGDLAQQIGSMDSTSIVNDLKLMLDETRNMTDEQIRQEIIAIAAQYNVKLTDNQITQLITLCRSLEGLDPSALKKRVEEVQSTLNKVSEAKTQVVGFVQTVTKVVTSIREFFERIKDIVGL